MVQLLFFIYIYMFSCDTLHNLTAIESLCFSTEHNPNLNSGALMKNLCLLISKCASFTPTCLCL